MEGGRGAEVHRGGQRKRVAGEGAKEKNQAASTTASAPKPPRPSRRPPPLPPPDAGPSRDRVGEEQAPPHRRPDTDVAARRMRLHCLRVLCRYSNSHWVQKMPTQTKRNIIQISNDTFTTPEKL